MCEETKPHPHKDVIIAWANGAEIEHCERGGREVWITTPSPLWCHDLQYRVKPKPKPKVKKWRWMFIGGAGHVIVTKEYYTEERVAKACEPYLVLNRIDSTMIEVEE